MNKSDSAILFYDRLETKIGELVVAADSTGLRVVTFVDRANNHALVNWVFSPANIHTYSSQLKEYFAGERHHFDLPLAPQGTPFQCKIWRLLTKIPYGKTITYGELARQAGSPGASRAVGNANGQNPIVIIQPCHRVIATDNKIGGFSAGISRKHYLLKLERGINTLF